MAASTINQNSIDGSVKLNSHIENMDWYIDANTLENIITNLTGTNIEIQGCTQCIEIEKDGTILECLANNRERKNMKIMKIDDMISIEEC